MGRASGALAPYQTFKELWFSDPFSQRPVENGVFKIVFSQPADSKILRFKPGGVTFDARITWTLGTLFTLDILMTPLPEQKRMDAVSSYK